MNGKRLSKREEKPKWTFQERLEKGDIKWPFYDKKKEWHRHGPCHYCDYQLYYHHKSWIEGLRGTGTMFHGSPELDKKCIILRNMMGDD